jgi:alkylation response protein AidB-like acyl-CoA dehydrogenase
VGDRVTASNELLDLRLGLRKLLDVECSSDRVRAAADATEGFDRGTWTALAEAGWLSLGVPEEFGGGGETVDIQSAVCEELGRALGPTLASLTVTVSGPTLSSSASAWARAAAERCASGEELFVPVVTGVSGLPDEATVPFSVDRRQPGRLVLDGTAPLVLDAGHADTYLVAAADDSGAVGIYAVPSAGAEVTRRRSIDVTRSLGDVTLRQVEVAAEHELHAPGAAGLPAYRKMVSGALLALTAESAGGQSELLKRTLEYAGVRHQFDRPIASFQVIKHRMADLYVQEQANAAALALAVAAVGAGDHPEVGCAKARVTTAFSGAAGLALQTHGGIGYTWEHDCHLFLKRAELNAALYGPARWHYLNSL